MRSWNLQRYCVWGWLFPPAKKMSHYSPTMHFCKESGVLKRKKKKKAKEWTWRNHNQNLPYQAHFHFFPLFSGCLLHYVGIYSWGECSFNLGSHDVFFLNFAILMVARVHGVLWQKLFIQFEVELFGTHAINKYWSMMTCHHFSVGDALSSPIFHSTYLQHRLACSSG